MYFYQGSNSYIFATHKSCKEYFSRKILSNYFSDFSLSHSTKIPGDHNMFCLTWLIRVGWVWREREKEGEEEGGEGEEEKEEEERRRMTAMTTKKMCRGNSNEKK